MILESNVISLFMRFTTLFTTFLLILFFSLSNNSAFAKRAAIIVDFETEEVLFQVNADTLNYPASLAKMMTIYIIFDYLDKKKLSWDTKLYVSETAASRSPSKLYLEEGSYISVQKATMALIVKSANDAATVISEHISGSEREFAKLMTKYAKRIGMKNTTFKNASGLPNRAQLTTARDIATLSRSLIFKFPNYYKLFSEEKFIWKDKTYRTHNRLMLKYKGADGIKTGYIKASGFQLAFSAVRKNKRLIGVYFGGDSGKQRDKSLAFLMDKVFDELKINSKEEITKKNKKESTNNFSIVVGTFKYKKNAKKQIEVIKKNYPKTTNNKDAKVIKVRIENGYLYETRFEFFTKKNAYEACKRLKKYDRDCFVRG